MVSKWDQGRLVAIGWTYAEQLVILNDEGLYRLYDLQGEYQQFSLGHDAAEAGIIDARIYEQGLVAMTSHVTLMEVKGWTGAKPLVLANPGFQDPPQCWGLIEPDLTVSRHVEALMSHEATLFSIDSLECVDQVRVISSYVQRCLRRNADVDHLFPAVRTSSVCPEVLS